ncbi:DUF1194 domain-containing protein [Albidovulum sediminicola]|uniref:DUF1194 domain-containing protein n=1 Tax=Albidovulum sediminicola TaxID=2984331 RepID=A0ABT2YY85_9RHOB|nr:DUF1194 domain-containing protein [Defluviimonas sp. WL0075]MCV2863808.1 DUF1194 domain-containing protein [Defluviimonas sp. WL0075]
MRLAALLSAAFLSLPTAAAPAEEVDLELLLMVDVSRSMSAEELEIQRQGYARALTGDAVAAALGRTLTGRIALAYVEWAGEYRQSIRHDWALIEDRDDLEAFAATLLQGRSVTQSRTSIASALRFGAFLIGANEFAGLRRVIDISGDGPNNQGGLVTEARDEVLAEGITINGLPLMTHDDYGARWRLEDLDIYYSRCVVGGPGAFVVPVTDWRDFSDAVTRKLVLEIAGAPVERLHAAQADAPYDCQIGEKMWRRNRRFDDMP